MQSVAAALHDLATNAARPDATRLVDRTGIPWLGTEGRGVPQDYAIAHMWLNLAAAGGNKDAAEFRDALAAEMTPAQIAEAQSLARERKPGQK